jgi:hypothetical protein
MIRKAQYVPPSILNNKHLYAYYLENNKGRLSFAAFAFIISEYNKLLRDKILTGNVVNLSGRLGTMYVQEKERNLRLDEKGNVVGSVDWGGTYRLNQKKDGKLVRVFHTSNFWYRIYWCKPKSTAKGKSIYSFSPCKDFRSLLSIKLNDSKTIQTAYRKNSKNVYGTSTNK